MSQATDQGPKTLQLKDNMAMKKGTSDVEMSQYGIESLIVSLNSCFILATFI